MVSISLLVYLHASLAHFWLLLFSHLFAKRMGCPHDAAWDAALASRIAWTNWAISLMDAGACGWSCGVTFGTAFYLAGGGDGGLPWLAGPG